MQKKQRQQTFHIPLGPGDALRNFFFVSSGTSNHTKGVIRFQEGSEHPSSHSFSSHLHLQTKWKSISFKKSSNTSKYFDSRTWGLKSTYWAAAYTRDYVAEWDCFLSTTFFKSPRLSPENNRRVMRMHLNLNTVRGTGCGGENINRIYTAFFYRKLYELIRRLFPCLESCAALGKCWLSWSSG